MMRGAERLGAAPGAVLVAADHAARHWSAPAAADLRIGGDAHRDAVCRMFRETFNPYRPSIIDWPKLSPDALARLTGLPGGLWAGVFFLVAVGALALGGWLLVG